jgi:hypothetical protein
MSCSYTQAVQLELCWLPQKLSSLYPNQINMPQFTELSTMLNEMKVV